MGEFSVGNIVKWIAEELCKVCYAQRIANGNPILYLSPYFLSHRAEYYRLLNGVRAEGGWELWIEFFATATRDCARQAVETAHRVPVLIQADRERLSTLGRAMPKALAIFELFRTSLMRTIRLVSIKIGAPLTLSSPVFTGFIIIMLSAYYNKY